MKNASRRSPELQVQQVKLRRAALRVATRKGDRRRPPLIILNGMGAKLEALQGFTDVLNSDIGLVLFDVPGTGGSPARGAPLRFSALAELMTELLQHLGHEQADVLGVSWGGALAQEFAYKQPAHCRRMILGATACGPMTMIPGSPVSLMTAMNPLRLLQKDYVAKNAMRMFGGRLRDDPQALGSVSQHLMGGDDAGKSLQSMMYQMMPLMGWSSLPWLHRLQQPTLVIAGRDDPIVPPVNGRLIAGRIPHARFEIVECGHLFLLTLAREVAAMVDDFLLEAA